MDAVLRFLAQPSMRRPLQSLLAIGLLLIVRMLINAAIVHRTSDPAHRHHWRRASTYVLWILLLTTLGWIWIGETGSLATFLGLASAGIAIAMHDTIANLAGWVFIIWRRPFQVGDRVEIAGMAGDVIDISLFQFSLIEIGNWVDADQSTGRIAHVPNGKVLRETLVNYETGFEYIWHEVPVLITFESDWERAKEILTAVVERTIPALGDEVAARLQRSANKFVILYPHLTPIVYTTVRESGVLLTIRYLCRPRQRRGTEQSIWEEILREFGTCHDIDFAYPTHRFFDNRTEGGAAASPTG